MTAERAVAAGVAATVVVAIGLIVAGVAVLFGAGCALVVSGVLIGGAGLGGGFVLLREPPKAGGSG